MPDKVTASTIIDYLKNAVEGRATLNPEVWLDGAWKLTLLVGDENEKLNRLRQEVAIKRLDILKGMDKRNVSEARLIVEATDEYRQMKDQEARCEQIDEFIRVAKLSARSAGGM